MLIMRSERFWLKIEGVRTTQKRFKAKSFRCSYFSEGNFESAASLKINDALANA